MIHHIRNMSGSLRPPMLDRFGLEATLEQLLKHNFSNTGVVHEFEYVVLPEKLPASVEITVYRIVQEAVTNIVRHAGATRVGIEINTGEGDGQVEIIVRDNGKGFDAFRAQDRMPEGFGLIGMGERISLLGGKLTIRSKTGERTVVHALLPLERTGAIDDGKPYSSVGR